GMLELDFSTIEGTAKASSIWSSHFSAENGFIGPGFTWSSGSGDPAPQSIWYEFDNVLRVVQYSFQSRTDVGGPLEYEIALEGPQSYEFWGSNDTDCSKHHTREVLQAEKPGTPFTRQNNPKVENVDNPASYRCYGFTVYSTPGIIFDVPGRQHITISNIRYFYIKEGPGPVFQSFRGSSSFQHPTSQRK
ncbi:unnamed protein product, partial [Meganyctiphanes norvegica]